MKKHIYIILVALPVLALSCVKEDAVTGGNGADNVPITFTAATYAPQTKASSSTAFTDTRFHVTAWTDGGIRYMNDVEVSNGGSGNVWSTTSDYYWPKADSLRFVATHGRNSSSPWAVVNEACTTLTTGDVTFHPVSGSTDSLWLYTDRTGKYTYNSGNVPVLFKNGMAAVKATLICRMSDDVLKKETSGTQKDKYRVYDTLSTGTVYYVVPFGFTPNGEMPPASMGYPDKPYPTKVRLATPITHIWRIVAREIEAKNVGNIGSLSMTLGTDGKWVKPSNEVWTIENTLAAHKDSVELYNAKKKGDVNGTPIPANLNDYQCPIAGDFLVMPQDLNWSSVSTINNQKANVDILVEVYNDDTTGDGIFDYRDVYRHWLCKKDGKGAVTDSVLVADTAAVHLYYSTDEWSFYKWYEWDGTGSSVLQSVHETFKSVKEAYKKQGITFPDLTFAQVLGSLTPHLKYPLSTDIDLAKTTTDETSKYWKMNTRTTYNISISPVTNEIIFNPQVTQWVNVGSATAK